MKKKKGERDGGICIIYVKLGKEKDSYHITYKLRGTRRREKFELFIFKCLRESHRHT